MGAFGALTAGLIALLGRRPARGALMVAALYGAGAGALADAALKRLGEVAPEAAQALRRDLKAATKGAQHADSRKKAELGSEHRSAQAVHQGCAAPAGQEGATSRHGRRIATVNDGTKREGSRKTPEVRINGGLQRPERCA